jgi:hypothetical protein
MAQNEVQSSNALFWEDMVVYIADYSTSLVNDSKASLTGASWTNLGAVTEFSRESAIETAQPPSMNVEHQQQVTKMAENINVTLQELTFENYNKLIGAAAQSVTVTGSSTEASDTSAGTELNFFYKFAQQSWSSTSSTIPIAPTDIIISGAGAYTTPEQYEIIQDANFQWGIMFTSTGGASTDAGHTAAYDFFPRAGTDLYHGGADELTPFMICVYALMADGRTLTSYYPRVEFVSGGAISDKAQGSGEYKDIPFTLQAREHESYTYGSRKQYKLDSVTA